MLVGHRWIPLEQSFLVSCPAKKFRINGMEEIFLLTKCSDVVIVEEFSRVFFALP